MKRNLVKRVASGVVAGILVGSVLMSQAPMVAHASSWGKKLVGYIKSDSLTNQMGFQVSIPALGRYYTYTTENGYFEFPSIPVNMNTIDIKITQLSFLTREVNGISISDGAAVMVGTQDKPIQMFAGDINKDNAINQADKDMLVARLNSGIPDPYNENSFDLKRDGIIDTNDLAVLNSNFGKTSSSYLTLNDYESISNNVCTWKDNKKCAYTPTYDDAWLMDDHVTQATLHSNNGIKGTLFINTEYDMWGNRWDVLNDILEGGYLTLGSHTMRHQDLINPGVNLYEELKGAQDILQTNTGIKPLTLAYPRYLTDDTVINEAKKYYVAARWGSDNPIEGTNNPGLGINPSYITDFYRILSMCPDSQTPATTFNGWLDRTINQGGWLVTTMHGITLGGKAQSSTELNAHYMYTKTKQDAGDVWTDGFEEVAKYAKERQNAVATYAFTPSANTMLVGADLLENSGLDSTIYTQPLTIKAQIPSTWNTITVDGIQKTPMNENGKKYVLVNIVPGSSSCTISKVN